MQLTQNVRFHAMIKFYFNYFKMRENLFSKFTKPNYKGLITRNIK